MGIVFLPHYQMFGLEENCFRFFTWMTNHQIFGFGIRGLGGHICKKNWIILQGINLVMGYELIFIMQGGEHEGYF